MAQIKLEKSGTIYECAADDTVLRAALRSGLGFPYECNVGSCATCLFELVEGKVEHNRADAPAWNERHRQRNRYLGCQARPLGDCRIKIYLRDQYRSQHRPRRTKAHLLATENLTHDIREFRFRLAEPAPFLAGQYALFYVPGLEGARPYSMCNVSATGDEWHFQIKHVPNGSATPRLFALEPGVTIGLDGPYGMAYLREDVPRDVLCIAGGSGLSPMVSIARAFAASPKLEDRHLHFVYGGRRVRDICGDSILRMLEGYGTRIHYYPVISEAADDPEGGSWTGRTGFVHEAAKAIHGERMADHEVYFAGPPAMAEAVQKMLYDAKVPPTQIHFDKFY